MTDRVRIQSRVHVGHRWTQRLDDDIINRIFLLGPKEDWRNAIGASNSRR